jgi:hypothetical protein
MKGERMKPSFDDPNTMDSEMYETVSMKLKQVSAILWASADANIRENERLLRSAAWDLVDECAELLDAWWHAGWEHIRRQEAAEP